MLDDAKLDELLALAEKSPKGPYEAYQDFVPGNPKFWCADAKEESLYFGEHRDNGGNEHAAKWIAACDPDTIRELVQEVKAWRKTPDRVWHRIYDSCE